MQYIKLGKTQLNVSTISFGAWAIGGANWGPTDDEVSKNAIRKALDLGVNLIDTADVYGFGHSEELIADIIKERGKGDLIIATKAGNDFYNATKNDDEGYGPIKENYKKEYIIFAAEQSLKRLGVDSLDILQLHSPDISKLMQDEPWLALEELKKSGKIRFAGLSIKSFKETEKAILLDEHYNILDTIQVRYNLLEREAEKELLPKAMKYGIGVIVRIPLLFGLLTGKFTIKSKFGDDDHRKFNLSPEKIKEYLLQLEKIQPLFNEYPAQTMAQVSLRYCISHPACHIAIPGAKTPQQVMDNCAASDFGPIPQEILDKYL
ncbi:MAG: aldo/keto reductase [Ignavibacteriales bacterium]|nr:aldo/keto reductase [Ignavibacteriales bacterium]